MEIVKQNEFDSLVFLHSEQIRVQEKVPGVVQLSFGPIEINLAENAARDFLYELTGHFAQKDLLELGHQEDPIFQESKSALIELSHLRSGPR